MSTFGQTGVLDADDVYLVEMFPLDRSLTVPETVGIYLADVDTYFSPSDPDAPAVEYDGRVSQALSYRRELWRDGVVGGGSLPSRGALTIVVDDELRDSGQVRAWRGYAWDGRRVRVLRGKQGADYSTYEVLLDGLMSGVNTFSADEITIGLSDLQTRLSKTVHAETYGGTGGFDGGDDLKGVSKPWGFGIFRTAGSQQINDPADLWYDVDPLNGLDDSFTPVIEDGGVPYTLTASNPPSSGQAYVDYANGRIRLGTAPTNSLTITAKSLFGAVGTAGEGATIAADLMSAVLTDMFGFTTGEIDTDALDDLAAANTSTLGRWYSSPPSGTQVLDDIVASIGGYYTTTRGGLFTAGIWSAPTAANENDAAVVIVVTDEDLVVGTGSIEPVSSPPYRVEIGYRRSHTVLSANEFSGAASEARREFMSSELRYIIDANSETESDYLLSEPLVINTLLDGSSDAADLADDRKSLFCVSRESFVGRLQLRPFTIEPGQQIWVRSESLDVDAAFRLVSVGENARDSLVNLRAWR